MIDQRAVVHPSAKLGKNVVIGPWVMIGENVTIDEGTEIASHTVVGKNTRLGKRNKISPFASIGTDPQSITYKGDETWLEIGDENIIREFTTINRGTKEGRGITRVGNNNYLMAYSHVAHDCIVGNHIVFANLAQIAGYVEVGDHAILGAYAGVHQFCRIGAYTFLGRATKIYQDILPYMLITGNPGAPRGLNSVGLRRNGFDVAAITAIKQAYQLIYRRDIKSEALCAELTALSKEAKEIERLIEMITTSKRGFARPASSAADETEVIV